MNPIILQNQTMRLEFSSETGALLGLTATQTGWPILNRPALGLSFRLLMPVNEELRNNPVPGEKQRLTQYHLTPDSQSITLVWDNVYSERAGRQNVRLTLAIHSMTPRLSSS